jgi:hypothetical protein
MAAVRVDRAIVQVHTKQAQHETRKQLQTTRQPNKHDMTTTEERLAIFNGMKELALVMMRAEPASSKKRAQPAGDADLTDEEQLAFDTALNELNTHFTGKKQRISKDEDDEEEEEPDKSASDSDNQEDEEEEDNEVTVKGEKYGSITEDQLASLKNMVYDECVEATDTKKYKERDMNAFMCGVFKWKGSYNQRNRKRGESYTPAELLNIERIAAFINLALPEFRDEIKDRGQQLSGRLGTIRSVFMDSALKQKQLAAQVAARQADTTEGKKKKEVKIELTPIELDRSPLYAAFKSEDKMEKMVDLLARSVLFFRNVMAKPVKVSARAAKAAAAADGSSEEEAPAPAPEGAEGAEGGADEAIPATENQTNE